MSWRKTHDIAVKVGTYTDRDGKEKGRYENVGHILSDGEQKMLCLKRTFNPAGVAVQDGRDTVVLSVFPVKEDRQPTANGQGHDWSQAEREARASAPAARSPAPTGDAPFDDDIPFAPHEYRRFA